MINVLARRPTRFFAGGAQSFGSHTWEPACSHAARLRTRPKPGNGAVSGTSPTTSTSIQIGWCSARSVMTMGAAGKAAGGGAAIAAAAAARAPGGSEDGA
eukprot:4979188-Prymnesium_polylepis.1